MRLTVFSVLFLVFTIQGTARAEAPLMVIFDIEDQSRTIRGGDRKALAEYMAAKMAEGGHYRVVPMSRVRKLLRARKIRRCREWGCKSSIGWEFKTHKLLVTRVHRLGRQCVLTSNLHGLKSAAVERSATAKGKCKQEALTGLVEQVVATLTGKGRDEPQQAANRKAVGVAGADEPGLSRKGRKVKRKKVRRAKPKPKPEEPEEPGKPFPLWPTLASAGVAVVGLGIGLPLLAVDGKGANCTGETMKDYANCESIYNTKGGGWAMTVMGLAGVAASGVLLYFYMTSPREEKAASIGINSVGFSPMPEGGAAMGITGRF